MSSTFNNVEVIDNKANNVGGGGAILQNPFNVEFNNCKFHKNTIHSTSKLGSGGGVYILSNNRLTVIRMISFIGGHIEVKQH